MSVKIPPLLQPYLALPPEASLTLLTSVLGASTNWLLLRYLYTTLQSPSTTPESNLAYAEHGSGRGDESEGEPTVVLVSFLRDWSFWKEGARRLGLDLDEMATMKRVVFLDGLGSLFLPRGKPERENGTHSVLRSAALRDVSQEIQKSVQGLRGEGDAKVVLAIDGLDLLLAAGGVGVDAVEMETMLLGLQEYVRSTIITLAADQPLVSSPSTPLESNHAGLLLSLAHKADLIMSLRLLDTGTARDVSGVLRITAEDHDVGNNRDRGLESRELLYFVGGDGGVKVFERGQ